ncbi:MAG: glutamate mutase L [Candidatus Neomarinimicrobiota bacterium]
MSSTSTKIDPETVNVILATDCGSTTTKAILIQRIDGHYRQTHRGEAPSTVEEPFADVTVGVLNAVTEVAELSGRRLIDDKGGIIRPSTNREGCDLYISTSSAGGGLQMMVAGVIREMTAASAKRAALGAGAIVMDVIASNDQRKPHEQIERIRELRPDMMLISGGTDGGTTTHVVKIAELVAPAKPQPRFGAEYQLPIIYAGNRDAVPSIEELFRDEFALTVVDNIRPVLERENLGPARDAIHDLFLEHVMAHAPGYGKLMEWTDAPIMPTPGAVGNILQTIAQRHNINVVGVDIGGATTDVFSVFEGTFNRTVSANLGMSYSIANVCAEATLPNILRWVHVKMEEGELRNRVKNKMIRPTTIPQSMEALIFEQAVAREALRLAYAQHKEFATTLRGIQQQRSVGDTFSQQISGQTIVDSMKMDLLVASGGVLSHAPRMHQTAMLLIDAFQPEGVTTLAKDSIFMMPHLGVMTQVHSRAAMEVFEKDCLIYMGTVVAPAGRGKAGKRCFSYTIRGDAVSESGEIQFGQLKLLPMGLEETAEIVIEPAKSFDAGGGPGKRVTRKVRGGTVGLILDGRGRPLELVDEEELRRNQLSRWIQDLDLYLPPTDSASHLSVESPSSNGESLKAHSYTPGLRVSQRTSIRQKRILPINGKVLVKVGETVDATQVVAETLMPGDVIPVNLANLLSVPAADVPECCLVEVGEELEEGDLLARTKGIFGLFKNQCECQQQGTVETISEVTGQLIMRGPPHPVNVLAFVPGKVIKVIEEQGVIIESEVSFIQGIFGIGGETFGTVRMACDSPDERLTAHRLKEEMKNCVIVGGARMTGDAIRKAVEIGASGIVAGGIDDEDLNDFLGYDLGVAITGSENLGLTVIVTEGFGDIAMAQRTFDLLKSREGAEASINGATQIRAGVIRPSVIIPADSTVPPRPRDEERVAGILEIGYPVRAIRDPYFGRIGKIHKLPSEPRVLDSGSRARVLEVVFDSGEPVTIPRANVELIEGENG